MYYIQLVALQDTQTVRVMMCNDPLNKDNHETIPPLMRCKLTV